LPENAMGAGQATARFWARPDVSLPVRLREIAAQADPNMRTYAARFALPDAPDWARLGMTATIQLGGEAAAPSARIPLSALHDRGRGPMVWLMRDEGRIEAAPVTVLALSESMATIRAELPEGTRIVAMGAQLLAPDSRVRPVETRLAGALR